MRFDHAIIAVKDLEAATRDYQALGFTVIPGGEHAGGATHNALICFADGSYIELLAPTGKETQPGDFSDWLKHGEGLVGYALLSDDLDRDIAAMQSHGIALTDPKPGQRQRADGTEIRWRSAFLPDDEGVRLFPFFIQDETPRTLRVPDAPEIIKHSNGATGIGAVAVVRGEGDVLRFQQMLAVEPQIKEQQAVFVLGAAMIVLMEPINNYMRHHRETRGTAPYSVTIKGGPGQPLATTRTHGARLHL